MALCSRMVGKMLGTRFFGYFGVLEKGPSPGEGALGLRGEVRGDLLLLFFPVASMSTNRPLRAIPDKADHHSLWPVGAVGLVAVRPSTHPQPHLAALGMPRDSPRTATCAAYAWLCWAPWYRCKPPPPFGILTLP